MNMMRQPGGDNIHQIDEAQLAGEEEQPKLTLSQEKAIDLEILSTRVKSEIGEFINTLGQGYSTKVIINNPLQGKLYFVNSSIRIELFKNGERVYGKTFDNPLTEGVTDINDTINEIIEITKQSFSTFVEENIKDEVNKLKLAA